MNQGATFSKAVLIVLRILGALVAVALIGYLNWLVIQGWFGGNGPANLGSIEVSYVTMGRFLVDFGWKTWMPLWYFGFPFHLFYTPLLPVAEWVLNQWQGMPLWEAYRFVTGWGYILAPISVFFLGWALSRRWIGGLVSGILYSVGPTIFYFVLPATPFSEHGEVAADRFFSTFWEPRRFTVLVRWGEGPHTLSLIFLPLVGAFFIWSLRRRNFWLLAVSAFFLMLTALSNALGMMGALLLVGSIAFVYFARRPHEHGQTIHWTLLLVLLGIGLAGFWYNLSFLKNFFAEGGGVVGRYFSLFPWGWLAGIFSLGLMYVVFSKFLKDTGVAAALLWFFGLFTVVYYYYASSPPELFQLRVELLPQALRYMTQVDMALSVLIGTLVGWVMKVLGRRFSLAEIILTGFVSVGLCFSLIYVQPFLDDSSRAASNIVDLSTSREKVIADWLNTHVDSSLGERVFLPGNYDFYLNWFTDIWQHRGGLFQASTHFWPDHIHYQMSQGKDKDLARAWLVVMNAKYAVITGVGSSEIYKEIKNYDRFDDMPIVYDDGGDIIYDTLLVRSSPAKPVREATIQLLKTPEKADDKEAVFAYADWVEKSSLNSADFQMLDHDHYRIAGRVDEGEVLLVQMTADPGWRASDERTGKRVRKGEDPLGFLVLYPEPGEFAITLKHGRTWIEWLGYLTTPATVGFIIWYGTRRKLEVPAFAEATAGKEK
ncbi:MAG: hypothetical protein A2785_02475 [Candidatus Chisholmbacteria bacterium RIFCSPHIGHO2_01_FULL_49_18]|uniref:Membrane protein 6-pyruvoyl-tetrahydropterin synthase-related domain-containing protein n=1 Tax=Candidatus Chisholmbacteria bacterium RIFCSPHIGHO2_01_FULL_49_18 TaxID=1797590 RepID=A0A1G1VP12_9BACT|nr:MAG: hypothetical protein A2785_02475 [Candidatus Chisholmbacteria bacterium RIFCSPHIGHO2_01_FULL_49_18]